MIWQRVALMLVAAGMVLVIFITGRHWGERSSVTAFRVTSPPVGWLQITGSVRHHGIYSLSDIKMTNDVIQMAVPLCAIKLDQASLESVLKKQGAVRLDIACPAGRTRGLTTIEPLSGHQRLVLLGTLSVNSSTVDELCLVPGIGPVMAQRIVRHRQNNGDFRRFEDLLQIEGIAEKKLALLKAFLTI